MVDLFIGEFKRTWLQTLRYPTEAIGGVVILTAVFYGIFFSTQYMAGSASAFGDRLDSLVVGYVTWTLVLYILNDTATSLQMESQTGTLEQVFLSPFGAFKVFLVRSVASLTLRLLLILVVLGLILWITGSQLAFPSLLFLPLLTLILAASGLAFLAGSLALVFKRVQQLLGLFQFVLLFLLATPTEDWTGTARTVANMLPILPSIGLLRGLMAKGEALDWGLWAIALANGLIYFALGVTVFRWAERKVKKQGTLGGY
ncbi:MAG: ABC transporter [Leptolyngbya foveolarum]|uniref:ABC transporter n=1 Tax=Leptolyngbya foveolarum TaxID=47253 RepID=A0A2W4ULI3_9CYAN|nr:MAG: ABC transporter [Leptolyngbya foveolarum]